MSPQRYLYSQQLLHFCLYKPFPGILQHVQIDCAVILHGSAFNSLNVSTEVFSNNTETFFFFHLRDRCKSCRAASTKTPWAGPNGRGLQSQPVGIPGASGPRSKRAPLATSHYRVTFRGRRCPSQVSPLDWDKLCRFFYVMCPVGAKSVSPSCQLKKGDLIWLENVPWIMLKFKDFFFKKKRKEKAISKSSHRFKVLKIKINRLKHESR